MNRYTVNVTAKVSGSVEVEAETAEEAIKLALEKADIVDLDEWNDTSVDDAKATDPELLSELCDQCEEDLDDCICEVCGYCDRLVDDCECDEDEEDEDDDEDED